MSKIQHEILLGNYWEHFKIAKDFALIYDIDDPRRTKIEEGMEAVRVKLEKEKENDD